MTLDRREFLTTLSSALVAGASRSFGQSQDRTTDGKILGQGDYRWRVVPGWGVLDADTPVKDCHAMVQSNDGRLFLLTNETKNNVIIYDKNGKLLGKWGTEFPGAHGLTLGEENGREIFYLTDHDRNQFFKMTLEGEILRTWDFPEKSGKYGKKEEFKPTHVATSPDGGFFVVDGYGRNWCHRYDERGEWMQCFGGDEGGGRNLACAHGAWVDSRNSRKLLWITSRTESKLKRFTQDGELVDALDLTGSMPNYIVPFGDHTVIPCLRGNQPGGGRDSNGFLCVLDPERKVISNLAAPAPEYTDGKLAPLKADTKVFTHPHGILIDDEENIYVAQWNSGRTYPIKLERVKA